jgi:hypothetical protein
MLLMFDYVLPDIPIIGEIGFAVGKPGRMGRITVSKPNKIIEAPFTKELDADESVFRAAIESYASTFCLKYLNCFSVSHYYLL